MAPYLLIPATRYLIPLGTMDPREVAPLSDAALTSYHAVKRSLHLLGPGSTGVVIGAGGLGQMAIQILRALSSATTVVAVDTIADKLATARRMGADEALVSGDEAVARIKDMTRGWGAQLVLDMVGATPTLQMAAQVARVRGHLTIVAGKRSRFSASARSDDADSLKANEPAPLWARTRSRMEAVSAELPRTLNFHHPAGYLYALETSFTRFYEQCRVLQAEGDQRRSRLALCHLSAQVLRQGLSLLGIDAPQRM